MSEKKTSYDTHDVLDKLIHHLVQCPQGHGFICSLCSSLPLMRTFEAHHGIARTERIKQLDLVPSQVGEILDALVMKEEGLVPVVGLIDCTSLELLHFLPRKQIIIFWALISPEKS